MSLHQSRFVLFPALPAQRSSWPWLLAAGQRKPSAPTGDRAGLKGAAGGLSRRVVVPGNGNRRQRGVLSGNKPTRAPIASQLVISYGTFVKILDPCGHKMPTGVLVDLTKVIATSNTPLEVLRMAWVAPGGKSVRWCGGP